MSSAVSLRGRSGPHRMFVALFALLCVLWGPQAQAHRAALVIGNGSYANASALTNPVNDARLVAEGARKAGFDVTLLSDVSREGFTEALRTFRQQADGAEVAMVYFAGHGIESGGRNWLLPVDVRLTESRDLRYEAIELDGLLEALAGAQLRMVVLDACRNNPFGNSWRGATRAASSGLAETEVEGALVIYAAAGGQVATDGAGGNSPFARSLAKRLAEPGLSIHRLGSALMDDVMAATGGQQRPWTNASIASREFYLVESKGTTAPTSGSDTAATDALMWQGADTSGTAQAFQAYLRVFPNGIFANNAHDRIARLQGTAKAAPVAAVSRTVAPVETPDENDAGANMVTPIVPAFAPNATSSGFVNVAVPPGGPPLPGLPAAPRFQASGYPSCREDYKRVGDPIGKVDAINRCMGALDSFFETTMNGYARTMIAHQGDISRLYSEKVGGQGAYSPEEQQAFYRAMMKEHADSNPGGANFADHAATRTRYDADRAYLQDRYCFATGNCGGYPVPAGISGK